MNPTIIPTLQTALDTLIWPTWIAVIAMIIIALKSAWEIFK